MGQIAIANRDVLEINGPIDPDAANPAGYCG
jgi:hypothetical protein